MSERLAVPQPWEELSHTADVGIRVRGATPEDTLARLVCAFGQLLTGVDHLSPDATEGVEVPPAPLPLVAVDVLREVLFRFSARQRVPAACRVHHVGEDGAEVELETAPFDPEFHTGGADVKAVTLHAARFEAAEGEWFAEVILDI